jgi:hypothetical protein
MQVNTVSAGPYNFTVTNKNRPFGNNFVVQKALVSAFDENEIECVVLCTANSKEPGRTYYCIYSTKGSLLSCSTLN